VWIRNELSRFFGRVQGEAGDVEGAKVPGIHRERERERERERDTDRQTEVQGDGDGLRRKCVMLVLLLFALAVLHDVESYLHPGYSTI
jgi:hypothetical protein